jgi:hypothetical protein
MSNRWPGPPKWATAPPPGVANVILKGHFFRPAPPVQSGLGGGGAMYWPAVSPLNPNLMFVSCDMGGLYRSTDGGSSWRMVDGRQMAGQPVGPVVCDPTDVNVVLAYGNLRGLRRSRDQGNMVWDRLADPPGWTPTSRVTAIAVDPSPPWNPATERRLLLGTTGAPFAFFSDNAGQSWQQAPGVSEEVVGILVVTDPASTGRLYFLATTSRIYRSNINGTSWQPTSNMGLPAGSIRSFTGGASGTVVPPVVLYITVPSTNVAGNNTGGVWRSEDQGQSWTSALGNLAGNVNPLPQYELLGSSDATPHRVYVTVRNAGNTAVYRSDQRGQGWASAYVGPQNDLACNVEGGWLDHDRGWGFGGPARGFAVSRGDPDCAMFSNAGALYTTRVGGMGPTTPGSRPWRAAYTSPATTRSADQPWSPVGLGVTTAWYYDIDPHPGREQYHYICYTDICFARSTDGGQTWRYVAPANPWKSTPNNRRPYNTFYQLIFDPQVPGRMWAAASDQHDIPWDSQHDGAVQSGVFTEHRGSGGVVFSTNNGETWSDRNNGLPVTQVAENASDPNASLIPGVPPVVSLELDPRYFDAANPFDGSTRRLWASVWGAGVYYTQNGGANWSPRSTGLGFPSNTHAYKLYFHDDATTNGRLFCCVSAKQNQAGTYQDSGLFRSSDLGQNWTCITTNLHPNPSNPSLNLRWAVDYAVHPANPDVIYLCVPPLPGQPGAVWKTANGGQSWSDILNINIVGTTLFDRFFPFAVTLNPADPEVVHVTTRSHGVWVSTSGGAAGSWQQAFDTVPFLGIHRMSYHPTDSNFRYFTTFGGGVWQWDRRPWFLSPFTKWKLKLWPVGWAVLSAALVGAILVLRRRRQRP